MQTHCAASVNGDVPAHTSAAVDAGMAAVLKIRAVHGRRVWGEPCVSGRLPDAFGSISSGHGDMRHPRRVTRLGLRFRVGIRAGGPSGSVRAPLTCPHALVGHMVLLMCRYGLDTSQFGYDPAAAEAGAPPPPPLIPRKDGSAAQRRCAVM